MSEPFLGEIRLLSFGFSPVHWAKCDGQLINISENPALFALLDTRYGGDGRTTFGVPDLRGRLPVHPGNGVFPFYPLGYEKAPMNNVMLPSHQHGVQACSLMVDQKRPDGQVLAKYDLISVDNKAYGAPNNTVAMKSSSVTATGAGAQPTHYNMQPYSVLNFCIALEGLFPSRN